MLTQTENPTTFEENLKKVTEQSKNIVLLGDLNCDIAADKPDNETEILVEICETYDLHQLITKPTRINPKSKKATTIDHIWTDYTTEVIKAGTIIGISDHFGVYSRLKLQKPSDDNTPKRVRNFKNYKPEQFRLELVENLLKSDVAKLITDSKLNEATEKFLNIISKTANRHAPIITLKKKRHFRRVPWYTDELEKMIKAKKELLKDYYFYGCKIFYEKAQLLKNDINHMKRKLQKQYYTAKIDECDCDAKKLWMVLKDVTRTGKTKESTEPDNMTQEKANIFNKFFATIGINIQKSLNIREHINIFTGIVGFDFQPESEESISKLIDTLRSDVATGTDDINARFIKDAKDELVPILTQLINLSYKLSQFPDAMKKARIKALHKKDSTEDIANYRPISILPVMSKIFERSGTNQMASFLEANGLINPNQHAYRAGHSTTTCLAEVTDYLYQLHDQKKCSGVASLDLSKAYDSISHTLLLHKLSKMGFSEFSLMWIKSYLENRKQIIKFNKYTSTEETVMSGIPQGSIIGPILFVVFTNDLAQTFTKSCKMVSYADDVQLVISADTIKELIHKIEEVIQQAQKWYELNSMKNNIGKTEVLIINNGKMENKIKIKVTDEGKSIGIVPKKWIKVLGVYLDENLNWKRQISEVRKKSSNAIRNLHRVNQLIPIRQRVQLYNALITPHFSYCDIIWAGCGVVNSRRLQVTQNYAARSILGMRKRDSATDALKSLKLLNLAQRRNVHEAVFIHKALNEKLPANITKQYSSFKPTSNTRAAQSGKLNLPKHSTAKFQNSLLFRCIKTWNGVPDQLEYSSTKQLKTRYQRHLIMNTYGAH